MKNVVMAIGLAVAAAVSGCSGPPAPPPIRVELSGTISGRPGMDPAAVVHVSLYQSWFGEGKLRHPLNFIETFETPAGQFEHGFNYPMDAGEGLIVYAWQDTDGDGVFCTPVFRGEYSDLVEIADFPSASVSVELFLEVPCGGPDWFFPGPAPG